MVVSKFSHYYDSKEGKTSVSAGNRRLLNYSIARCALDRIWSSTQRLEDLDWFRLNVPYVQYRRWYSRSIALESGAQSS